ncbi:hypothetical protein [Polluticoccus soli]|uniref:hypothetical protein n=1 Tax=Polluticoccus soli TaxID=3034150 RepID=UPI0023E0FC5D|nr:hypothetical protein [Flavipsychrobacter sp. JY13-12]
MKKGLVYIIGLFASCSSEPRQRNGEYYHQSGTHIIKERYKNDTLVSSFSYTADTQTVDGPVKLYQDGILVRSAMLDSGQERALFEDPEIRLKNYVDSLMDISEAAIALYSSRCWIEDCGVRGFICYQPPKGKPEFVMFRYQRLFQKLIGKDTLLPLGTIFQHQPSTSKESALVLKDFDRMVTGLTQDKFPHSPYSNNAHNTPYYVWCKKGTAKCKFAAVDITSRTFEVDDSLQGIWFFRRADSIVQNHYDGSYTRTIDP